MKKLLPNLLALMLVGCATSSSRLNSVSVGMTKAEVLRVMGQPQSVSAKDGLEYLLYTLGEGMKVTNDASGRTNFDQVKNLYFVRLKGGAVESFGRVGDFDSTKIPETKQTIDVNINK